MIADRQDYKFVDVPNSIAVDGGIMPARDTRQDGSWKVLRGEDPAFLMEATAERRYSCADTMSRAANPLSFHTASFAQSVGNMDRDISKLRLNGVHDELKYCWPMYAYSFVPDAPVQIAMPNWQVNDLPQKYNVSLGDWSVTSPARGYDASSRALYANEIRSLFATVQTMQHPTAVNYGTYALSTMDVASVDGDDGQFLADYYIQNYVQQGSVPDVVIDYTACNGYQMYTSTRRYGSALLEAQSGDYKLYIPSNLDHGMQWSSRGQVKTLDGVSFVKQDLSATQAIVEFRIEYRLDTGLNSKYVRVPVPLMSYDAQGLCFLIDALEMTNAAHRALSLLGVSFPSYTSIPSNRYPWYVHVYIQYINAIYTLGDHTDFSFLNWSWQP